MWRCSALLTFGLLLPGCTQGDACLRHSDCREGLRCVAGACAVEGVPSADASVEADAAALDGPSLDAPEVLPDEAGDVSGDFGADGEVLDGADADPDALADGGPPPPADASEAGG